MNEKLILVPEQKTIVGICKKKNLKKQMNILKEMLKNAKSC